MAPSRADTRESLPLWLQERNISRGPLQPTSAVNFSAAAARDWSHDGDSAFYAQQQRSLAIPAPPPTGALHHSQRGGGRASRVQAELRQQTMPAPEQFDGDERHSYPRASYHQQQYNEQMQRRDDEESWQRMHAAPASRWEQQEEAPAQRRSHMQMYASAYGGAQVARSSTRRVLPPLETRSYERERAPVQRPASARVVRRSPSRLSPSSHDPRRADWTNDEEAVFTIFDPRTQQQQQHHQQQPQRPCYNSQTHEPQRDAAYRHERRTDDFAQQRHHSRSYSRERSRSRSVSRSRSRTPPESPTLSVARSTLSVHVDDEQHDSIEVFSPHSARPWPAPAPAVHEKPRTPVTEYRSESLPQRSPLQRQNSVQRSQSHPYDDARSFSRASSRGTPSSARAREHQRQQSVQRDREREQRPTTAQRREEDDRAQWMEEQQAQRDDAATSRRLSDYSAALAHQGFIPAAQEQPLSPIAAAATPSSTPPPPPQEDTGFEVDFVADLDVAYLHPLPPTPAASPTNASAASTASTAPIDSEPAVASTEAEEEKTHEDDLLSPFVEVRVPRGASEAEAIERVRQALARPFASEDEERQFRKWQRAKQQQQQEQQHSQRRQNSAGTPRSPLRQGYDAARRLQLLEDSGHPPHPLFPLTTLDAAALAPSPSAAAHGSRPSTASWPPEHPHPSPQQPQQLRPSRVQSAREQRHSSLMQPAPVQQHLSPERVTSNGLDDTLSLSFSGNVSLPDLNSPPARRTQATPQPLQPQQAQRQSRSPSPALLDPASASTRETAMDSLARRRRSQELLPSEELPHPSSFVPAPPATVAPPVHASAAPAAHPEPYDTYSAVYQEQFARWMHLQQQQQAALEQQRLQQQEQQAAAQRRERERIEHSRQQLQQQQQHQMSQQQQYLAQHSQPMAPHPPLGYMHPSLAGSPELINGAAGNDPALQQYLLTYYAHLQMQQQQPLASSFMQTAPSSFASGVPNAFPLPVEPRVPTPRDHQRSKKKRDARDERRTDSKRASSRPRSHSRSRPEGSGHRRTRSRTRSRSRTPMRSSSSRRRQPLPDATLSELLASSPEAASTHVPDARREHSRSSARGETNDTSSHGVEGRSRKHRHERLAKAVTAAGLSVAPSAAAEFTAQERFDRLLRLHEALKGGPESSVAAAATLLSEGFRITAPPQPPGRPNGSHATGAQPRRSSGCRGAEPIVAASRSSSGPVKPAHPSTRRVPSPRLHRSHGFASRASLHTSEEEEWSTDSDSSSHSSDVSDTEPEGSHARKSRNAARSKRASVDETNAATHGGSQRVASSSPTLSQSSSAHGQQSIDIRVHAPDRS